MFQPLCDDYIDLHTQDYTVDFVSKFNEFNFNQDATNLNEYEVNEFEKSSTIKDGGIKIKVNKDKGLLDNHPTYFS